MYAVVQAQIPFHSKRKRLGRGDVDITTDP